MAAALRAHIAVPAMGDSKESAMCIKKSFFCAASETQDTFMASFCFYGKSPVCKELEQLHIPSWYGLYGTISKDRKDCQLGGTTSSTTSGILKLLIPLLVHFLRFLWLFIEKSPNIVYTCSTRAVWLLYLNNNWRFV